MILHKINGILITRLVHMVCCGIAMFATVTASAVDWAKIGREMKQMQMKLERAGVPRYYIVNGKKVSPWPKLGIGVHGINEQMFKDLKKAHIRYVRRTIYWHLVENTQTPGVYNEKELERFRREIDMLTSNNLIPLVVVHGSPHGISYEKRHEGYKRFAALMGMMAKRFPKVKYWELWNEMDDGFTPLFGADAKIPMIERGKCYAEMLKEAYPAIKKANSQAVVVVGGMVDFNEFPKGIYAGGGKKYFDIMNLHTYGVPLIWSYVERGNKLRQIMNANGDRYKPIWNTEFGSSADALIRAWGPHDAKWYDQTQASQLMECLEFNRKAGLYQLSFIYQYQSGDESSGEIREKLVKSLPKGASRDDYSYGIVRLSNGKPTPFMKQLFKHNPLR